MKRQAFHDCRVKHAARPTDAEIADAVLVAEMREIPTEIFEEAGRLDPAVLRTLDAIHVAAALALGDDLDGLVTYDVRLAAAAEANGIAATSPR